MNVKEDKTVIGFNLKKTLMSLLILVAFIIAAIFMWVAREDGKLNTDNLAIHFLLIIVSYIGAPFMLLLFMATLYPIALRKPAFVIDAEGIIDYSGLWIGLGKIDWHNISSIHIYETKKGKKELHIYLTNNNEILSQYNLVKRTLMNGFHGFNNGIVGVQLEKLNISPDILLLTINKHLDRK